LKWLDSPHFEYVYNIKLFIIQNRKEDLVPSPSKQLNLRNISNVSDYNLYKDLKLQDVNNSFDANDKYAYLDKKNLMPIINLNPRNSQGLSKPIYPLISLVINL
jgi:hypothetical protein